MEQQSKQAIVFGGSTKTPEGNSIGNVPDKMTIPLTQVTTKAEPDLHITDYFREEKPYIQECFIKCDPASYCPAAVQSPGVLDGMANTLLHVKTKEETDIYFPNVKREEMTLCVEDNVEESADLRETLGYVRQSQNIPNEVAYTQLKTEEETDLHIDSGRDDELSHSERCFLKINHVKSIGHAAVDKQLKSGIEPVGDGDDFFSSQGSNSMSDNNLCAQPDDTDFSLIKTEPIFNMPGQRVFQDLMKHGGDGPNMDSEPLNTEVDWHIANNWCEEKPMVIEGDFMKTYPEKPSSYAAVAGHSKIDMQSIGLNGYSPYNKKYSVTPARQDDTAESLSIKKELISENADNQESQDLLDSKVPSLSKPTEESENLRPYKCEDCPLSYQRESAFIRHIAIHSGNKPFACVECSARFSRDSFLFRHKVLCHTATQKEQVQCKVCHKEYSSKYSLKTHMGIHSGSKWPCNICAKQFTFKSNLKSHIESHKGGVHDCVQCSKSFSTKRNLLQHFTRNHTHTREKHQCNICAKQFAFNHHLKRHIESHSGDVHNCSECSKSFSRKCSLKQHAASNHAGEKHQCNICAKQFIFKNSLKRHIESHSGDVHNCSECFKSFSTKYSLKQHAARNHAGEKHQCNICAKQFISKNSLKHHIESHNGDVQNCSDCSKSFSTKYSLKKHAARNHTGEKHQCNICAKQYPSKHWLNQHLERHIGIQCNICAKKLSDKYCLKVHLKTHLGNKYQCDICAKQFRFKGDLRRHIASHLRVVHNCVKCSKSFYLEGSLRRHVRKIHGENK